MDRIIIAGGGPAACHILTELARSGSCDSIESITIIDDRTPSEGGRAHSDPSPAFRVNMRTNLHNIPGQRGFEDFLADYRGSDCDPPLRADLGRYTAFAADHAKEELLRRGCEVRQIADQAVGVVPVAGGYEAVTRAGSRVSANRIVLATGQEPPALDLPAGIEHVSCYTGDSAFAHRIRRGDRVVVHGTGPGAIDVARYLLEEHGLQSPVHLCSRRGLLSAVQTAEGPRKSLEEEVGSLVRELESRRSPLSLELMAIRFGELIRREDPEFCVARLRHELKHDDALTQLRHDIADAKAGGPPWRIALETIGAYVPRLWRLLDSDGKRRFLHEDDWLRLYYTKRHAMQMGTAEWLAGKMGEGRISVSAGELPQYERLVIATGPDYYVSRTNNPLLRQMQEAGLARPYALSSGRFEIGGLLTSGFQLDDAPRIWAMGALLRGEDFAVHSYPALARHARSIVAQWS